MAATSKIEDDQILQLEQDSIINTSNPFHHVALLNHVKFLWKLSMLIIIEKTPFF